MLIAFQVQITTNVVTISGTPTSSVYLGNGAPSSAPAYPTPASSAGPIGGAGTTLGTTWAAGPSASSSPIVPATGSGAKVGSGLAGVAFGVIAALAAL
jgi:hypothetical protein